MCMPIGLALIGRPSRHLQIKIRRLLIRPKSDKIERMNNKWQDARFIQASEIGDYIYCNQQWWLKQVNGIRSTHVKRMQAGTVYHAQHADQVDRLSRREWVVSVLTGLALMGILLWLIVWLGGG